MIRRNARARHADRLKKVHGSGYSIHPCNVIGSAYKVSLRFEGKTIGKYYDEAEAKEAERQHKKDNAKK